MTTTLNHFSLPRWFVLGLLGVLVLSVMLPRISLNTHALERHGSDAVEIRRCINEQGAQQVWKKTGSDRWLLLCQLLDNRWGIQIVQKIGDKYEEITAFVRENGDWNTTRDYLIRQATKWRGGLP